MTDTKEPRTAEEWADWAIEHGKYDDAFDRDTVVEAICRAQNQARKQAIEECASLLLDRSSEVNPFSRSSIKATMRMCESIVRELLEK